MNASYRYILGFFFMVLAIALQAQKEDFRKQAPKPGPAPKIEIGKYEQFKLNNGLEVIVVENHKLPRVSFEVYVDVPIFREGQYKGAADLAGQLLSTGTTTRTKAQIDEAVDFIGANLSSDNNGVSGSCLSKHKDKLVEILADVLLHPSFPAEEFEKLRKQTTSSLAMQKDDPESIAGNVSKVIRYGKSHPYGEIVTEQTLDKITIENCKEYYSKYIRPDISYLIVVGDISLEEVKKMAEKYFSGWQNGGVMKEFYAAPTPPEKTTVDFVDRTGAVQSVVNITYPVKLKPGTTDGIKARLLNAVLGGGSAGRLFKNLREDKGYTYGAYSTIMDDRNIGYFEADANVRNEVTDSAIMQFLYEMKRLRDEPVSDKELELAKNVLAGTFSRSLENPSTIARFALNTVRYKLSPDFYATYLQQVSAVTVKDLQEIARQIILPDQANIVVVGEKDEVAQKLKPFAKDGEVHYFDAFGNKIEPLSVAMSSEITPVSVISDYVNAIGGKEKLDAVKDVKMVMSTSIQGMNMEMTMQQKAPGKMAMSVDMGGMVVNQTKFDGEKGAVLAMGQAQPVDEETLEGLKEQAIMFPELTYEQRGYQLTLKGIESVEGQNAYKVEVARPNGDKITEFYNVVTHLKIRSVSSQPGPQGDVTVINDFGDYQEVDGIKFPFKTRSTGIMPVPLVLEVKTVEINKGIDDSVFKVE